MRILFIYAPIRLDANAHRLPLGVGYLCSVLKKAGHEADVLDLNMLRLSEEEIFSTLTEKVSCYDAIGVGGLITIFERVRSLIGMVKKIAPAKPVLVGGPMASYSGRLVLEQTEADVLVMGEGEKTIVPLLEAIMNKNDLSRIRGIGFRDREGIKFTDPVERVSALDAIPFVSYESFETSKYIENFRQTTGNKGINMIASRGCPHSCVFCARNFGTGIKYRSVGNVVSEIDLLMKNYDIEQISFNDELFTANKSWVHEFCDEIIKNKFNLKFTASSKPNCIDRELLIHMKEAGFFSLMYGVESANDEILRQMNKKHTKKQVVKALDLAHEIGMDVFTPMIIGMPAENANTVKETVEFCKDYRINLQNAYYFITPYPGSKLYDQCLEDGIIRDEVEYVRKISDLDIDDFSVNLTDWTDAELMSTREEAINEVQNHLVRESIRHDEDSHEKIVKHVLSSKKNIYLAPFSPMTEALKRFLVSEDKRLKVNGYIDSFKNGDNIFNPEKIFPGKNDLVVILSPNHKDSIRSCLSGKFLEENICVLDCSLF